MLKYVLKRLLIMIPVLFCATFIVYMLFYMAPSNADRSAVRRAAHRRRPSRSEKNVGWMIRSSFSMAAR